MEHARVMSAVRFLDGVLNLALRCGVQGAFTARVESVLYDRVLYERQEAPRGSSDLASFHAVEGRTPNAVGPERRPRAADRRAPPCAVLRVSLPRGLRATN